MSQSYQQHFGNAAAHTKNRDVAQPFSLRLTPSEKTHLKALAGDRYLSDYIRSVVFGEAAKPRRKSRKPKVDDEKLARVLGALGSSRAVRCKLLIG